MNFEAWQLILSALSGGVMSEIIRYLFSKKKDDAETDRTVSDSWKDYAEKLENRLDKLEAEYWPLKAENALLKSRVANMEAEMSTIKNSLN